MNVEGMDMSALLANWETKRAALDAAIASLRAAIAAGALGATMAGDAGAFHPAGLAYPQGASGGEIPNGAFRDKTVSEAIKAYLSAVRKKQTTRDIVDALKRGGIESTSEHFDTIAYNALERMRTSSGEIAKFGKMWGLTEWLPLSMRSAAVKSRTKQRGGKPKKSAPRRPRSKPEEGPTLPARIEEFLGAAPDKAFTPSQIAAALGVDSIGVNVRLKKMVTRQRIAKVGPGQYRAGKTGVVKMAVAG